LKDVPDGIYYFAVQFGNEAGLGPIARYKFQIDTTPPKINEFSLISKDSSVEIKISATDTLSGLDKIEIYVDDSLYKTDSISETYSTIITGLTGEHRIKVIVKDKASNEAVKEGTVSLRAPEMPQPEIKVEIPKDRYLYLVLGLLVFIFFIVLILILRYMVHFERAHKEIKELKLERLRKDAKKKLEEFLKEMKEEIRMLDENPNLSEAERNIYRRFKEIIEKAEKEIEEELK
jgi:Na+-transporting methylmalonyl-CoA/oxaloacetate decarboxylase gamma subunit